MIRATIMGAVLICAAVVLAACGGDEISQAELERERADAAQSARQQAEIKDLRQELQRGEPERPASESGDQAAAAPPPSSPGQIPSDARYCGSAYGAGTASCPFVENVNDDYHASGGSGSFTSYSPTTDLTYAVTCNGTDPTVCAAGRGAVIYIP